MFSLTLYMIAQKLTKQVFGNNNDMLNVKQNIAKNGCYMSQLNVICIVLGQLHLS
jgi:hypothetical protein